MLLGLHWVLQDCLSVTDTVHCDQREANTCPWWIKGTSFLGWLQTHVMAPTFLKLPGVVVHTFNSSTLEAEAGRSEFEASVVVVLSLSVLLMCLLGQAFRRHVLRLLHYYYPTEEEQLGFACFPVAISRPGPALNSSMCKEELRNSVGSFIFWLQSILWWQGQVERAGEMSQSGSGE